VTSPPGTYWDDALGRQVGPHEPAWDAERFSALVATGSDEIATTGRDTTPAPAPDFADTGEGAP
jgi:hypothetical protein